MNRSARGSSKWSFVFSVCLALGLAALHLFGEGRGDEKSAGIAKATLPFAGFERNQGQADGRYEFVARASRALFLAAQDQFSFVLASPPRRDGSARVEIETSTVTAKLIGSNPDAHSECGERQAVGVHYALGSDPKQWLWDVPRYDRVTYSDVYPGIDLVYYGREGSIEYDFIVHPGANPNLIRYRIDGATGCTIDAGGDLVIQSVAGELRHRRPVLYQHRDGARVDVSGAFRLTGSCEMAFEIGVYDGAAALIIDPIVLYSTFIGVAGADGGTGVAVDGQGNAYVTGVAPSVRPGERVTSDVFVAKLDTNESGALALKYSIIFGGLGDEASTAIAAGEDGVVYIGGTTSSMNFPTRNALQPARPGDAAAFLTRIDTRLAGAASLTYSSYFGGTTTNHFANGFRQNATTSGIGIAATTDGNAFLVGYTNTADLPTKNALMAQFGGGNPDGAFGDGFLVRIDATKAGADSLVYATYLGGTDDEIAFDVAADSRGNAYITGGTASMNFPTRNSIQLFQGGGDLRVDAFATRIDTGLSGQMSLVFSTFLGGDGDEAGIAIRADEEGNAVITGLTNSANFPVRRAFQSAWFAATIEGVRTTDGFLVRLDTDQSGAQALDYGTYLGGNGIDGGLGLAAGAGGRVVVTGATASTNFPTRGAIQGTLLGAVNETADAFVAEFDLNQSGAESLVSSTYLGGTDFDIGVDIALDRSGYIYLTGVTNSQNYPVRGAFQGVFRGAGEVELSTALGGLGASLTIGDTFLTKLGNAVTTVSAASFVGAQLARDSIVATFGTNLATATAAAEGLPLPTTLGGTNVRVRDVNGVTRSAPLFYVSPDQINFLIPPETATGEAYLIITSGDGRIANGFVQVARIAPSIFTANTSGQGAAAAQALLFKPDGSQTTSATVRFDPALGRFVFIPIDLGGPQDRLFLVLFGTGIRGTMGASSVGVRIGGVDVEVSYAGPQGFFVGLDQINVLLPRSLQGRGAVDVTVTVEGRNANTVQVSIQ